MAYNKTTGKEEPGYHVPSIFAAPASSGGYVPSAAAMGSGYTPSAAASNGVHVPSMFAAPSQTNNNNYTSTQPSANTGGYVPSAAAMGLPGASAAVGTNTTSGYVPSAGGSSYTPSTPYVPSAAAAGSCSQYLAGTPTTTNTSGYVPSAAATATGASSYTPSAAGGANASSYVPSAAAMGAGGSSYTPSAGATPSAPYVPSAAATSSVPYVPSAAAYVPSAASTGAGGPSYTPSAAATATPSAPYVPSAAAAGSCSQYTGMAATPTTSYSTPSMFSAPPPSTKPAPPKPSYNATAAQPNNMQQPQQPNQHMQQPQYQPQQYSQPTGVLNEQQRLQYEANQPQALKQADIWMISGCEDKQTSADISNVNSFQLPDPHGRAGGACTAALLKVLYENDQQQSHFTHNDVMMNMRKIIKSRGLSQIPQLSSAHPIDMNTKFEIVPAGFTGRRRAVIIGINYEGQKGALRGCHNDAFNMQKYVQNRYGFNETTMLIDDGRHESPTRANILKAYQKIVKESRPGDAIFLHYSGHGTKVRDQNGDEEDGYDEAMVPLDFKRAGIILDDDLYKIIVQGMSPGVHVVAVMDCCHSGTILDLPYIFKANGQFSKMEVDKSFQGNKLTSLLGRVGAGMLVGGILNAIF